MKITIALIVLAVLISFGPLFLSKHHGEGVFGGADGQAKELISRVRPEYKPWFSPLWTPPATRWKAFYLPCRPLLVPAYCSIIWGMSRGALPPPLHRQSRMTMHQLLDCCAYDNRWSRRHPLEKLVFGGGMLLLAVLLPLPEVCSCCWRSPL